MDKDPFFALEGDLDAARELVQTAGRLAVELQRDWARQDTVQAIIEIVLTDRLLKEE